MKYKLKDIGIIITGKTPSTKEKQNFSDKEDKYLFLTPKDMSTSAKYIKKTERYLTDNVTEKFKMQIIKANSVCISCIGSDMGKVYMVDRDTVTNQQINSITKINSICNPHYLYYYFKDKKEYLKSIAGGSTMPILNKSTFENIEIDLPDIQVQDRIVSIVENIDKKIELNNQINNNLLELGDTLIGKLNTDNQVRLGDLASVISKGTTPTKKDIENSKEINNIKFIRVTDFNEFGIDKNNLQYIPEDVHTGKLKRSILKENDILVSIAGTLGKIAIVTKKLDNSNTNQAVAFVRLKEINDRGYIYFYMKTKAFQDEIESKKIHAVQPNLSLTELSNIKIIKIDEDKKQIFNIILDKILQNVNQNYTLMQIRDTLLPKLIHGDIDLENINI